MKKILFTSMLLISLDAFCQKPIFTKKFSGDSVSYVISDSINIQNGKSEYVKVFFIGSVAKAKWRELLVKNKNEKEFFELIGGMLSLEAQYKLKNKLSFEPFKRQFFFWDEKSKKFICDYKLMGRNGYGNMVETSVLAEYDPNEQ